MKYYLKIETRLYNYDGEGIMEQELGTIKRSKLFDTFEEAAEFGEKLLKENKWLFVHPGDQGTTFLGRYPWGGKKDLVRFSYNPKQATFFISIKQIEELSFEEIDSLLKKYRDLKI